MVFLTLARRILTLVFVMFSNDSLSCAAIENVHKLCVCVLLKLMCVPIDIYSNFSSFVYLFSAAPNNKSHYPYE